MYAPPDPPPALHRAIGVYATPYTWDLGNGGLGLDVEAESPDFPITAVFTAMFGLPRLAPQALGYLRTIRRDGRPTAWGLVFGGGWIWTGYACPGGGPGCFYGPGVGPPAVMAGVVHEWRWPGGWLRLQPNLVIPQQYYGWTPDAIMPLTMGPAWVEHGWQVGDHLEVTLRSTSAPLRLAWRF